MAYVRWGEDSNLYIYDHVDGGYECCGCLLEDNFRAKTLVGILNHVGRHLTHEHKVPSYVIPRLLGEEKFIDEVLEEAAILTRANGGKMVSWDAAVPKDIHTNPHDLMEFYQVANPNIEVSESMMKEFAAYLEKRHPDDG